MLYTNANLALTSVGHTRDGTPTPVVAILVIFVSVLGFDKSKEMTENNLSTVS